MYPVVPALPRTVTNSFELGGYTAPVLPVLDRESRCNRLLLPAGAERADDLVLPALEGSRDLLVVTDCLYFDLPIWSKSYRRGGRRRVRWTRIGRGGEQGAGHGRRADGPSPAFGGDAISALNAGGTTPGDAQKRRGRVRTAGARKTGEVTGCASAERVAAGRRSTAEYGPTGDEWISAWRPRAWRDLQGARSRNAARRAGAEAAGRQGGRACARAAPGAARPGRPTPHQAPGLGESRRERAACRGSGADGGGLRTPMFRPIAAAESSAVYCHVPTA